MKATELLHSWWIGLQVGAPPYVQRTLIAGFHKAKEILRLATHPYLTLYQVQGQGRGGPLTVTYGGLGYAKEMLLGMLFTDEPVEREIGRVPLWRLDRLPSRMTGDLAIVEASRHVIGKLDRYGALVLPWRLRLVLDVRGDWQEVMRRFHGTVRNQEIRRVRKYGYEYVISRDDQDFEMFYRDMYVPSMKTRHGDLAVVSPKEEVYQYFRRGWLFLIKRDDAYVAGCTCFARDKVLYFAEIGVRCGDKQLIQEGAEGAAYYAMVHWANQNGYEGVDFMGSWPFMSSGLFQYKRKWGAAVSVPPNEHKQIWIKLLRDTPAVAEFLKDNPCVIVDGRGDLQGLAVSDGDGEAAEQIRKQYTTPGLADLLILPLADFISKPAL